jgi:hypothetical protein
MRSDARLVAFAVATLCAGSGSAQTPSPIFQGFRPGACALVPRLVTHFLRREQPDTARYDFAADTTATAARDSARLCAARYGATLNWWEIPHQVRVNLALGEDTRAGETASRYLASLADSSAEKNAWALYLMVADHLSAHPARTKAASEFLANLDRIGPKGVRAGVLAHSLMARSAHARWDDSTVRVEASRAIAQWKTLNPDDALGLTSTIVGAFALKAELELRAKGGDAARAVIDSAQRTIPAVAAGPRQQLAALARLYSVVGKKGAPVEASFWFKAANPGTPRPHAGKVFIISEASHSCGASCRPRHQALGRLERRFRERGLEIINTTRTLGFVRDSAPVSPEAEAKYDSAYFLAQKEIPGSLAVYDTKFRRLPDGRRVNEPTPQELNYRLATFTVVDRAGVIRYVALGWDPLIEVPLGTFIDRLLSEDASGQLP